MTTTTPASKKKLCWNCEGRVSLSEENCPYCAVYLGPAPDENGKSKDILAPPYRLVDSEEESHQQLRKDVEDNLEAVDVRYIRFDLKNVVLPLCLLSSGALCLLFGVILVTFSENGFFILQWKAENWLYYLLLSLPLLFLGLKTLLGVEEDPQEENTENQ